MNKLEIVTAKKTIQYTIIEVIVAVYFNMYWITLRPPFSHDSPKRKSLEDVQLPLMLVFHLKTLLTPILL